MNVIEKSITLSQQPSVVPRVTVVPGGTVLGAPLKSTTTPFGLLIVHAKSVTDAP